MNIIFSSLILTIWLVFTSVTFAFEPKLVWKIEGKESKPNSYTFSNDGKTLYIQYSNRSGAKTTRNIYIWDVPSNKLNDSMSASIEYYGMVLSDDGKYLVCIDVYSNITDVFDTGKKEITRSDIAGSNTGIFPGIFSIGKAADEDSYAVYEYSYQKIQIFNFETGAKVREFDAEEADNFRVKFSSNGKYVAVSNNKDTTVNIYKLSDGSLIKKIKVMGKVENMSFAKNNPYIIVNYNSSEKINEVQIYDFNTGNIVKQFGINDEVSYSVFVNNDTEIITGFLNGTFLQFNFINSENQLKLDGNYRGEILGSYTADDYFCSVITEGNFEIIKLNDFSTLFSINNSIIDNHIKCNFAKSTPNGKYIFTSDNNSGKIIIRDLLTGEKIHQFDAEKKVVSMDFDKDSKRLITCDNEYHIKFWNIENIISPVLIDDYIINKSWRVAFSPDGKFIISGSLDSNLYMLNTENDEITVLDTALAIIQAVAVSPDKNKIAFCTQWNLNVLEYDFSQNKYIRKISVQADSAKDKYYGGIQEVRFSLDGKFITIAASDFKTRIYYADNYALARSYKPTSLDTMSSLNQKAILFEKNEYLFVADSYPSIKIFNKQYGNIEWQEVMKNKSGIAGAGITPDDMYFFYALYDATIAMYKINGPSTDVNVSAENDLSIYPNPASDYIIIQPSEGLKPSEGYKVQIFNIFGVKVGQSFLIDCNNRINVSNLQPGVYYIRIGDKTEKFVKI